jgi:hypothetical protein
MTRRPTRRELERDVEDLGADGGAEEIDHVVINMAPEDPDPHEDTVIVSEAAPGGERRELTIAEYEAEYGPLDEAEPVADFTDTST